MSFDPDKFLADNNDVAPTPAAKGGFDPDAFLASDTPPPTPKPIPEPNFGPMRESFKANIEKEFSNEKSKPSAKSPEEAKTLLQAIEAGLEMSSTGLFVRGEKPDTVLPEDAPMYHRIASQIGTVVGDIPAMTAGFIGGASYGAAAGAALTVNPVGAAAGAFVGGAAVSNALPVAIRETLMASYEEGSVDSFGEFWEKASHVMLETAKSGIVGAATMGAGAKVGKVLAPVASPLISKAAVTASEVATMTTVGSALNGKMPEPEEFIDGAIVVAGLGGAAHVAGKLRKTYSASGVKPDQIVNEIKNNPGIQEDLISSNVQLPRGFEPPGSIKTIEMNGELGRDPLTGDQIKVKVQVPKETPKEEVAPKVENSVGGEKPPMTAEEMVLSRIGEDPKQKSGLSFDESYRNWVDDLDPLKRITKFAESKLAAGGKLPEVFDVYQKGRNFRGASNISDSFIKSGTVDFHTKQKIGPSLSEIVEPHNKNINGLRAYVVAARAAELRTRGIKTEKVENAEAFAKADAEILKNGKAEFQETFDKLQAYQDQTLSYLRDSGVLGEEAYATIKAANESYVPFYRIMDEAPSGPKGGKSVRNPIKEIKGSERLIADPIESIIRNTDLFVKLAERNEVHRSLVDLVKKYDSTVGLNGEKIIGIETGIERVKTKVKPIEVTDKEVQKFMDDHGIEGDGEAFNIFRPQNKSLKENEFVVFRDGKQEVYSADKSVVQALNSLSRPMVDNFFINVLKIPATMLRLGSTLSPDFMLRNPIRDQMSALVNSKSNYIPLFDFVKGAGSFIRKDSVYWDWMRNGGGGSAMMDINKNYLETEVFKLAKDTGFASRAVNVVKSPYHLLRVLNEVTEGATRLGEYQKAVKSGKSKSKAAFDSREVSIDFSRMGAKMTAVNQIAAFLNANVQGLDKLGRNFKEAPLGTATKIAVGVTAPSVALWYANHDDPRWKELPRWQKDMFWIVMTDEHIYRIPKPFEVGLIAGSLVERSLEAFFTDNPSSYKDFMDSMGQAFIPQVIPTAAIPVIETYANKNMFTDMPIIPYDKEKVIPELQFSDYTSEFSKFLGRQIGRLPAIGNTKAASPAVIDNLIKGWTGSLGNYALNAIDESLESAGVTNKNKPARPLESYPVIKAFMIRYPSTQAQSIQDVYSKYKNAEKAHNSFKEFSETNIDRANEFADKNKVELQSFSYLKRTTKALSNIRKAIDGIEAHPTMDKHDKREHIDKLYYDMIRISEHTNRQIEKMKDNINQEDVDTEIPDEETED